MGRAQYFLIIFSKLSLFKGFNQIKEYQHQYEGVSIWD